MKYSILGFSQEMAMKTSLDLTDLVLLKYINDACARVNMIHKMEDNTVYTWLSHKKIMEDLPILRIGEGTLKNRLSRLKQTGYIQSITECDKQGRGSRTFYGLTEVTMMLIYTPEETTTGSRENDVVTRPGHFKMTSNSLVENDNLLEKGISSKDEIYEKPSSSFLHSASTKTINATTCIDKFLEMYNKLSLPAVRKLTDKRKKAIIRLFNNYSEKDIEQAMKNIAESDFLLGKASDFKADIDWILKEDNFIKILEGRYQRSYSKGASDMNRYPTSRTQEQKERLRKDIEDGKLEKF